ncbi:hypothetical protein MO973_02615 [Paenibacillus sp. TRM 82003]|nr:hypothetical protein [Paenibacillus sp. TRM 82003]
MITYHRGASARYVSIDWEQFQSLLHSSNKVDALIQLLSRKSG